MGVSRRTAILSAAAGLAAGTASASPRARASDPIAGKLVINSLGDIRDPNDRSPRGGGAIPTPNERMLKDARASGITAINVTVGYVSGPADPFEATVKDIAAVDAVIRANPRDFLRVYSAADIVRAKAEHRIGCILNVQNCAMLGTKAERVDLFTDLGLRSFQLTYNIENGLGGGSAADDVALKPFGREVIERLNARRMIVDLSHSGRRTCLDAIAASKQAIAITHTGCRALRDIPRNKSDEELRGVGEKGGYVGIFTGSGFLMGGGRDATAEGVVRHIEHAMDVAGEDHVGVGTDNPITAYDNVEGVRANWRQASAARARSGAGAAGEGDGLPFTPELLGADQFRTLARAMARRGHKQARIDKVLGLNFLNYARRTWGA
jgi:membrane dipeptidase